MSPWKEDAIGERVLKTVALGAIVAALWRLAPLAAALRVETQIGIAATVLVVMFAGFTVEHVLSVQEFERGER